MTTIFISGHLDLTPEEFGEHYAPKLKNALDAGSDFVVGDARGADAMAQIWLAEHSAKAKVFHMLERPRNNAGLPLMGGFPSDEARDVAMTEASEDDIAWVRPGSRRRSGTAKNLERRQELVRNREIERDREERRALPRLSVSEHEEWPTYLLHTPKEGYPTVPMPADLFERYRVARKAWSEVQGEISAWLQRQERDPV